MDKLTSRLDLDHISNRPIVRWIVFFIALGALAKVDIDSGRMVLDENSIYPFLILTIVPASVGLKLGWQAFSVVRRCCIPFGVIVCMVNAVAMLANMDSQQEFLQAQRLIYAPLAFGILLSLLLRLVEPEIAVEYKLSFVEVSGLSLMLIVALPLAISSTTYEGYGFSTFWHGSAIAICMVVGLSCLPRFQRSYNLRKNI